MNTRTLRPGILVSLSTHLYGGVQRDVVERDSKVEDDGARVERRETVTTTEDPEEYARGIKVRSKIGSLIRAVCTKSNFGLLCPMAKEAALDEAVKEAHALENAFNSAAKLSRVSFYIMKGYVAESDTEAARAIASEIRGLLETMQEGVSEGDVKKIRDAANDAKDIGKMLDEEAGKKVAAAIEEARKAAREIVKRVGRDGEDKAAVIASIKLEALDGARFAFLDVSEEQEVAGEALPTSTPRALDMSESEPEERQQELKLPMRQTALDFDDDSEQADRKAASPAPARAIDC